MVVFMHLTSLHEWQCIQGNRASATRVILARQYYKKTYCAEIRWLHVKRQGFGDLVSYVGQMFWNSLNLTPTEYNYEYLVHNYNGILHPVA